MREPGSLPATGEVRSTWGEANAAAALFVIYPLVLLVEPGLAGLGVPPSIGKALQAGAGLLFSGALLAVMAAALRKGFPLWTYPYWGLGVGAAALWAGAGGEWASLPAAAWPLLAAAIALVGLLGRIGRPLRPLYQGIRQDWTRLSFAFLGLVLLAITRALEGMPGEAAVRTAISFILALGALAYMRTAGSLERLLDLAIAFALGWMVLVVYLADLARLGEAGAARAIALSLIEEGLILLALLLAPAALRLLPARSAAAS